MSAWIPFILTVVAFLILLSMGIAGYSLAPWVPARKKDLERIHKMINAGPDDTVYEIGCGNGRVSLYVHDNSDAKVVGIERAWPMALISQIRKKIGKKDRFEVRHESCFDSDYSDANIIYIFGMPGPMKKRLAKKLEESCNPGTRVVSYVFPIDPWEPTQLDKPSQDRVSIYEYTL